MTGLDDVIGRPDRGAGRPLADFLRDRPMSPTGFEQGPHGPFGDGWTEDRLWFEVESAVMGGRMSEGTFAAVRAATVR